MAIDKSIDRTQTLGGSDMGAIMGCNPYKDRVDLWLEKTGRVAQQDLSHKPAVMWGNLQEKIVLDYYDMIHGTTIERDEHIRGLTPDYIVANIDAYDPKTNLLIEAKTASFMAYVKLWGEGFPNEQGIAVNLKEQIPASYMCQLQLYMWAKNASAGKLILKADSCTYIEYPIARNETLINEMIEAAAEFWHLVKTNTQPKPRTYDEAMKLWFPLKEELAVKADDECMLAWEMLKDLKDEEERLETRKAHCKFVMLEKLQETGGTCLVDSQGKKVGSAMLDKNGRKRFQARGF